MSQVRDLTLTHMGETMPLKDPRPGRERLHADAAIRRRRRGSSRRTPRARRCAGSARRSGD